jgi:hypothetical protein
MSVIFRKFSIACTLMALATAAQLQTAAPASEWAQWDKSVPLRAYVPARISPEAAAVFAAYKAFILAPQPAPAATLADFSQRGHHNESARGRKKSPGAQPILEKLGPMIDW